jgi:hypothetical protein
MTYVVVAAIAGILLALCISKHLRSHEVARILLTLAIAIPSAVVLSVSPFLWWRIWNPPFDSGPYVGINRLDAPGRPPDQSMAIYSGFTIETYDPQPQETAPTVRLLRPDGTVEWSIFAVPYPRRADMPVWRIRFTDSRSWPFRRARVIGRVDWAKGGEVCWWFISIDGHLEEYWYSW